MPVVVIAQPFWNSENLKFKGFKKHTFQTACLFVENHFPLLTFLKNSVISLTKERAFE